MEYSARSADIFVFFKLVLPESPHTKENSVPRGIFRLVENSLDLKKTKKNSAPRGIFRLVENSLYVSCSCLYNSVHGEAWLIGENVNCFASRAQI